MRQAQSYFRRSLNFVNDFLEIDYLYRIKFIYHSIEASIGEFSVNRNAQKLLELTKPPQEKQERGKSPQAFEEAVSREHLSKVKEDIYKAVKGRSQSRAKSTSNSQLRYQATEKSEASRVTDPPPRIKEYPEYRREGNVPTTSPGKRSYVYLE